MSKLILCVSILLMTLLVTQSVWPVQVASTLRQPKPVGEVLRIGVLEDSPPYDFYNAQNQLEGMNIDIIREVGKRLNRPVKLEIISYNRVVMGLLFNQYDVIAAPQSVSPYRKTVVHFTTPYLISRDVLVTRPGEAPIASMAELKAKGYRVGVFNGTSYPQLLKSNGLEKQMTLFPTQREMFLAFLTGKIKVMMMDEQIAHYYRETQGLPFELSKLPVRTGKEMAFSVRKEDTALHQQINQALAAMDQDGTTQRIRHRWHLSHVALDSGDREGRQ